MPEVTMSDTIQFAALKRRPLAAAITTLFLCTASAAEEEASSSIEEMNVWGTTIKASSLDLGEDAIAIRQADHLSDLVRFIPGVDVGGAHSLNQRITIRSLDDKDLKVTIDGAIQNTYMFHHMGNLQIHADILRNADIDVGNNSVINGGLGGVSRFETRSAKDMLAIDRDFGARLNLTYADNASFRGSLTGYGQLTDNFDLLVYANRVNRDNYRVGGGKIKDANGDVIEGTDGKVRGLKGELTDTLIKTGFDITDNQRLKLGYEHYKDDGDYSARPDMGIATDIAIGGALGIDGQPQLYPTQFTRDTLTLNYDATFDSLTIEAVLFSNTSNLERDETYVWQGATVNEANRGEATNQGASVLLEQSFGTTITQTLTYGLETVQYDTEYRYKNYDNGDKQQSKENATSSAVFVQNRVQWGNLAVTPGARFNQWDIDSNLINKSYTKPTFALALDYTLNDATQIRASRTQLFKGPELSEVFTGAGSDDVYNKNIKAETGTNTEWGISHQGDLFYGGVTAFKTKINNYIYDYITHTLSAAEFPKDNIGELQLRGIEAFIGFKANDLDIMLTYTDIDSKLKASDKYLEMPYDNGTEVIIQEGFDGARTDRTHGSTYGLNIDYKIPEQGLQLHYDTMYVASLPRGKDLDGAGLDNSKDAYNIHNISLQWKYHNIEGLTLTLGIDNLLDEYYASQASRTGVSFHPRFGELYLTDYEPGRNIKAGIAYQF